MPRPKFIPQKVGKQVTLTATNREGRRMRVLRARFENEEVQMVDEIDLDEFIDTVQSDWRPSYQIQYQELDLSVNILEDNTDQVPHWYLAEPAGDSTFTASTASFSPSWGDPVTYDTIEIDNLQYGVKSSRQYTKR